MAFHFFSVLLLVVSTLFNAVPLDPVSRAKSAVCGSGYIVLSPQLESFCSTLDVLRLPAAPPVLTIDAPPFRLDLGLIQINASHGSSTLLTSTGRQALRYARRASTARRLSSSDPTSVDVDWMELYWTLFFFVLAVAANVYMLRYHFDSVMRGLALFFCGPPPRPPHLRVPQPEVYYQEVHYNSTPSRRRDDDPFWYISELALPSEQEEQVDDAGLDVPAPVPPASEPPVDDAPTNITVANAVLEAPEEEDPEPQERKRVRSAARCQRAREQKARAHEREREQQAVAGPSSELPNEAEDPEPQAENTDKERWRARGGKQVRKRQKAFERKLAARAAARAEAGPPSIPPVFNDENFPPLAGSACKTKLPEAKMSYALITAAVPPSPSALVRHAGPYTIRSNPAADFKSPQLEDKGKAVYYPIEELPESGSWDELMRADEMAAGSSRKGKRRKKGNG